MALLAGAQQLLPAGDARTDTQRGVQTDLRVTATTRRLHADQNGMYARRRRQYRRAAEGNRLRVVSSSRAKKNGPHEDAVRRLAGEGHSSVLHEKRGGYANNTKAAATKGRGRGCASSPAALTGFKSDRRRRDPGGRDRPGEIGCDQVVVGAGLGENHLGHARTEDVLDQGCRRPCTKTCPRFTGRRKARWVSIRSSKTNDGKFLPVIHVDSISPCIDHEGSLLTDQMGIYYKPDFHFGGIRWRRALHGGHHPTTSRSISRRRFADFVVGEDFAPCGPRRWRTARSDSRGRWCTGERAVRYRAFTPDSSRCSTFPRKRYLIADSNHGYKMIGVGRLVAEELWPGQLVTRALPLLARRGPVAPSNRPLPRPDRRCRRKAAPPRKCHPAARPRISACSARNRPLLSSRENANPGLPFRPARYAKASSCFRDRLAAGIFRFLLVTTTPRTPGVGTKSSYTGLSPCV